MVRPFFDHLCLESILLLLRSSSHDCVANVDLSGDIVLAETVIDEDEESLGGHSQPDLFRQFLASFSSIIIAAKVHRAQFHEVFDKL